MFIKQKAQYLHIVVQLLGVVMNQIPCHGKSIIKGLTHRM